MPLYEYLCASCGRRTEALQRFGDPPLAQCPECGGPLRKLLSAPSFQFKGSGWYATDYAGKSQAPAGSDAKESSASSTETTGSESAGGEATSSETKGTPKKSSEAPSKTRAGGAD